MGSTNHLQSPRPPWVELLVLKDGETHEAVITPPPGFAVKLIHGRRCKTKSGLLSEFARVLQFPPYFGKNWDAFEECLTDLEWLPADGYLLIVQDAESVLADDAESYDTLIRIIEETGRAWANDQVGGPETPFHVVFTVLKDRKTTRKHWSVPLLKRSGKRGRVGL